LRPRGEERLHFGAKEQALPVPRPVERLDPDAVADEEQRFLPLVPQREREHAAEAAERAFGPLLPGVDHDLGVPPRLEAVPASGQLRAQCLEVVELTVEHGADAAAVALVLATEGLVAARDVDDAQAPGAKRYVGGREEAVLVGTTVSEGRGHAADERLADGTAEARHAGYAAHHPLSRYPSSPRPAIWSQTTPSRNTSTPVRKRLSAPTESPV